MPTKTEIANLTLGHLAVGKEIANIDTEQSEEARVIRRYYDTALTHMYENTPWPFASKIATLGLLLLKPNAEWEYSYRYPNDCARITRILSGTRSDVLETKVPYRMSHDAGGLIIFTDKELAEIEYTVKDINPLVYPASFTMAFSAYLAFLCANSLTSGDRNLKKEVAAMYEYFIAQARAVAYNQEQSDLEADAKSIRARIL